MKPGPSYLPRCYLMVLKYFWTFPAPCLRCHFRLNLVPAVCASGSAPLPGPVISLCDNMSNVWWSSLLTSFFFFRVFPAFSICLFFYMNLRIQLSYSKTKQSNNKNASFKNMLGPPWSCGRRVFLSRLRPEAVGSCPQPGATSLLVLPAPAHTRV